MIRPFWPGCLLNDSVVPYLCTFAHPVSSLSAHSSQAQWSPPWDSFLGLAPALQNYKAPLPSSCTPTGFCLRLSAFLVSTLLSTSWGCWLLTAGLCLVLLRALSGRHRAWSTADTQHGCAP